MALPPAELERLSAAARACYLANDAVFAGRFRAAVMAAVAMPTEAVADVVPVAAKS